MQVVYLKRFRNRKKRPLLDLKGRFSLIHLGGGTFLYSYPGKGHPVVRKVELGRKRNRVRGLGVLLGLLFVGFVSLVSQTGTADSVSPEDLEKLEAGLTPVQLEERSEKLKEQLLSDSQNRKNASGRPFEEYVVQPGDSLGMIAVDHGVPVERITASSGINPASVLRPGQVLLIPFGKGLVHTVKAGDRLAGIADFYRISVDEIRQANTAVLLGAEYLAPGVRLFLPNARIPAPPPVWTRPAHGGLTSTFGSRVHPVYGRRAQHTGIDIAIRYGSVFAARDGYVTFAGWLGSYGYSVIIDHSGGYKTLYAHLSRLHVRRGQFVKGRTKIARSGNSGMSTGPHLHFEIIRNGRAINPRKKLRF